MNYEKNAEIQIQRQIDLLEGFSMPSWRLSRRLFSLPHTRAKQIFFLAGLAAFLLGLGVLWMVAWYGLAPYNQHRMVVTILLTSLMGLGWAGTIGILTKKIWHVIKARNPSASNVPQLQALVKQARNEPALKQALERALVEEGTGMLTQRQADALQHIAKTLTDLREKEKQRLKGLEALEELGLVTAARTQVRAVTLESTLPNATPSIPKPRF